MNKDFLPQACGKSQKSVHSVLLQTANREVVDIEGIAPMFIAIGELRVSTWIGIVENPDVHVLLGASFLNRYIRSIFTTERNAGPWHPKQLAIIAMKTAINLVKADNTVFTVNSH